MHEVEYEHTCVLQEKILPFVSVNEAVKLPEESTCMDEIEAELARLRVDQGGDDTQLDTNTMDQHGSGAAGEVHGSTDNGAKCSTLERGQNDAAVQVAPFYEQLPWTATQRHACHFVAPILCWVVDSRENRTGEPDAGACSVQSCRILWARVLRR